MLLDGQSNMRQNYINGGLGVFISGLAWLAAAALTILMGFTPGMIALFIGGMIIHPLSVLLSRPLKGEIAPPDKGLTRLSLLTLPLLFGGCFLAYLLSTKNHELFYPVMAVTIGIRYFIFQRIYGLKTFVLLGAILCIIGTLALTLFPKPIFVIPIVVGFVEIVFGVLLTRKERA